MYINTEAIQHIPAVTPNQCLVWQHVNRDDVEAYVLRFSRKLTLVLIPQQPKHENGPKVRLVDANGKELLRFFLAQHDRSLDKLKSRAVSMTVLYLESLADVFARFAKDVKTALPTSK